MKPLNGTSLRLGILGGTFDPVHLGHLRCAEEVGERLGLEKVYFVPSASPPHKTKEPVSSFEDRLFMVKLAVRDSPLLETLDIEGKREGPSYSIETLRELHSIFGPSLDMFFIIGIDAFIEIKTWKEYRKLFDYANFVIIHRPGYQATDISNVASSLGMELDRDNHRYRDTAPPGNTLIFMSPTFMDISSTEIRKTISRGRSVRFLVPESVREYIMTKRLYTNYEESR